MIFHIRRPLRPARGDSRYRDRSDRGQGTYCGAAETEYDVAGWRSKAEPWSHGEVEHEPCLDCVVERERDAGLEEPREETTR